MLLKIFLVFVFIADAIFARNLSVVCRTPEGYFEDSESSADCWYDPDVYALPEKLAQNHDLSLEKHFVHTEDGWILTIFRLKTSRGYGKGVILLQHGMMTDAMCFMVNGDHSIAFFLAKQGYDVWLGNFRGSEVSTHTTLKRSDTNFWDFSFHEHALYDLPSFFKHVTQKTHSKILYIGHSMGGTAMAIYLSINPVESKKYIERSVLLQSPTDMRHTKGLVAPSVLSDVYAVLGMLPSMGMNSLMEMHSFERLSTIQYCSASLADFRSCLKLSNLINGDCDFPFPAEKFFIGLLAMRNCAFRVMYHYAQVIRSGEFRMYDYGPKGNLKRYNSSVPTSYNLDHLPNDITWIYGATDALVTKEDAVETFGRFQKPGWDIHEIPYNHVNALVDNVHVTKQFFPLLSKIIEQHIQVRPQ